MSVERVELRPGYDISRVIKGGWQLAGGHGEVDDAAAVRDMQAFVDEGIDTFDCADIYTGVEALIGRFIRSTVHPRRAKIHTKLVPDLDQLERFTAADVEAIVDRSLERLGVERLDLVQGFWWDLQRGKPLEAFASLASVQRSGKIAHIGVTNFDVPFIAQLLDAGVDVVSAQVQYSLLDQRPAGEFSRWCERHAVHLLCYGVLAGGFLTDAWLGKPDPGFTLANRSLVKYRLVIEEFGGWRLFQALLEVLDRVAGRHPGANIASVAARCVLDWKGAAAVIIGARYAHHLAATLAVFDLQLGDEDRAEINAVLARRSGPFGAVYGLESDRNGRHGAIMKYNLNSGPGD